MHDFPQILRQQLYTLISETALPVYNTQTLTILNNSGVPQQLFDEMPACAVFPLLEIGAAEETSNEMLSPTFEKITVECELRLFVFSNVLDVAYSCLNNFSQLIKEKLQGNDNLELNRLGVFSWQWIPQDTVVLEESEQMFVKSIKVVVNFHRKIQ